jgi:ribose 5-phosphate isomerase B
MARTHLSKTIHVASDHAGFELKEAIVSWLRTIPCVVYDHGAKLYEAEDDFPDFITPAAKAVSQKPEDSCGIIFGGSGQGESMIANRFPQVRATVFYGGERDIITLSREHNDANVLSIGARFVSVDECKESILLWLNTEVDLDERHKRRIQKIEKITRDQRAL